ncbi:unannotated protein [freshwater metagenome]|uniref:Unannotated protein n=1 Tax=freshwater metagenome TaxID=449393 RepID=A0A6J6H7U2_9ZZZZ
MPTPETKKTIGGYRPICVHGGSLTISIDPTGTSHAGFSLTKIKHAGPASAVLNRGSISTEVVQ